MTLTMLDSIYPQNLPGGADAYLTYVDGRWVTVNAVRAAHPGARIVSLTVTGATLNCDGIDCEPSNPDAASAAGWAKRKLAAAPASRPVMYASVIGQPGYGMPDVLAELGKLAIARSAVRLLSAHYTDREHICSPSTCGAPFTADGTQWTSQFAGLNGTKIDMSALNDGFFGAPAPPSSANWTEKIMQELPMVREGSTDAKAVRTIQGALIARAADHGASARLGASGPDRDGVDGVFGPKTRAAVVEAQRAAGFTAREQDGIVGPQTWPMLLGV